MNLHYTFIPKLTITLIIINFLSFSALSQTINIPADYSSIQDGINAAVDGDTILVAPGTYQENINFLGKAIHLLSDQGPEQTIIDGNLAGSTVSFISDEGSDSIIDGFTITNGSGTYNDNALTFVGGGIYLFGDASPLIQNNIITQNLSPVGGGIGLSNNINAVSESSPTILNNTITDNEESGIYLAGASSFTISNNIISNNVDKGVDLRFMDDGIIQDNTFIENTDDGIYAFFATNVSIIGNLCQGNLGNGIYLRALDSSIIAGNTLIENDEDGAYVWQTAINTEIIGNIVRDNEDNGIYVRASESILIENNQISGNSEGLNSWMVGSLAINNNLLIDNAGDGVYLRDDTSVTFFNNTCLGSEIGIRVRDSEDVTMGNSIIRGNEDEQVFLMFDVGDPTITYSNIEGGFTGEGNIDADPLFADASSGDYSLLSGSPSIDAGDNVLTPDGMIEDLVGNPRFFDDPETTDTGNGGSPVVDMGPYEWYDAALSIDETSTIELSLFPNPVSDILTIRSESLISNVEIIDLNGKRVGSQNAAANEVKINVEALASGIYLITIESLNGSEAVKFIKR